MLEQLTLFGQDLPKEKFRKATKHLHIERGCATCTLSKKRKVFGKIEGKRILVIAMCPGGSEEKLLLALVGKAGKLFWGRAKKLGAFVRSQCDVDNVVRCRPTKKSSFGNIVNRNPSKLELHCCSIHTETQLAKAKPQVILLLGEVAQKQFLGKRYRADRPIFYDTERQCWIVCTYHPSFLLRGVSKEIWRRFDAALLFVKHRLKYPGPFDYLKSLDYRTIAKPSELKALLSDDILVSKRLPVFDLETDRVDGKLVILCCAICNKPGKATLVLLDHPLNEEHGSVRRATKQMLIDAFFANSLVCKGAWWGIYDVRELERRWQIAVKNYCTDGAITEYLSRPNRKDYQLDTLSYERFPEFAGYKDIVSEYYEEGKPRFSKAPIEKLMLRCCGDADLAKRAMLRTVKRHDPQLVHMLCDAAFVLEEMSERGQWFDFKQAERLEKIYTRLEKKIVSDIAMIADDPDFNPTDDKLRWLLCEKLKLNLTEKTRGGKLGQKSGYKAFAVGKGVLEKLYGKHPVIDLILKLRFVRKLLSTYISGFRYVAQLNKGLVKTRFKLWGTSTGRISSGSDRKDENGKNERVNLQNIHGDANAKNMLVSTLRWPEIVKAWERRRGESESAVRGIRA